MHGNVFPADQFDLKSEKTLAARDGLPVMNMKLCRPGDRIVPVTAGPQHAQRQLRAKLWAGLSSWRRAQPNRLKSKKQEQT
jgi:hypothetical protein